MALADPGAFLMEQKMLRRIQKLAMRHGATRRSLTPGGERIRWVTTPRRGFRWMSRRTDTAHPAQRIAPASKHAWLGIALIALGMGLIANSLLGPFVADAIRYPCLSRC
jgi:hypothetical protein